MKHEVVCHINDVPLYDKNQGKYESRLDIVIEKIKSTGIILNADVNIRAVL